MEIKKVVSRGGNKVTFLSGGTQPDAIRNITAYHLSYSQAGLWLGSYHALSWSGAMAGENIISTVGNSIGINPGTQFRGFSFDASRVVKTGHENSPRTVSVRIWRRIA